MNVPENVCAFRDLNSEIEELRNKQQALEGQLSSAEKTARSSKEDAG